LGKFEKDFAGQVCLLEEREPLGKSDNTEEMLKNLEEDNKYILDSATFFRARLLDILIADWDRHQDQWRWLPQNKGDIISYLPVPRDRDQVFFVNEGTLPKIASSTAMLSFLKGFNSEIKDPPGFYINGANLNQQFLNGYTYKQWMQQTFDFVASLPDSVLLKAIDQLPQSSKALRKDELFTKLKGRRDNLAKALDEYYRFLYKIVDVRLSDKDEILNINGSENGGIQLTVYRASDKKEHTLLLNNFYSPDFTKEIRIFTGKGRDSVFVNTLSSKIKIRIVGDKGGKVYRTEASPRKVIAYEDGKKDEFIDKDNILRKHLSADSLNTAKAWTNLYEHAGFSPAVGYRSNDGILLGIAFKSQLEGFRKLPYGNTQKVSLVHSVITKTMLARYDAEWKSVFRRTDFIINAGADIPSNRYLFFGYGNESIFNTSKDFRSYNRVAYSLYKVDLFFSLNLNKASSVSFGPSIQYTNLKNSDNRNRFAGEFSNTLSSKPDEFTKGKAHVGLFIDATIDDRDHLVVAQKGVKFNLRLQGYEGVKKYSDDFFQAIPEFSFYIPFDKHKTFVLANRTGGQITLGQQTFNQSAFLGGHDNLFGYVKFRFAGDNSFYNNLEGRISIPNFLKYFIPGKMGLMGFYDTGRVWYRNENSSKWHQGAGGGIYLAPFNKLIIRGMIGVSEDGVFPNVLLGQRF